MRPSKVYLQEGRLAEVIALIQILALSEKEGIYNTTIENDYGSPETDADRWLTIAKQHPEFFRIAGSTDKKEIRLISRYAGRLPTALSQSDVSTLVSCAISLHESQIKASQRKSMYFPILIAILSVAGTIILHFLQK